MITMIKFSLTFFVSFIILSIPVGEQNLFNWLHVKTSHYQQPFINAFKESIQIGKVHSNKFFNNTRPSQSDVVRKVEASTEKQDAHHETYTAEEKDFLIKVLQGSHDE